MTSNISGKPRCWLPVTGIWLAAMPCAAFAADTPSSLEEVVVTSQRLNHARSDIEPQLGASTYTFSAATIDSQPGGENEGLNNLVLQAPGVAQDSFGQLHVRGEHNGLQYRLNGIILPEGISVFGQSLSPRLASSVTLITGAVPAQYGLRTAGIIDIQTKTGSFDNGGEIGVYGGSHGTIEPNAEYGGSIGRVNYFVSGSFNQNALGIESPDGKPTPVHDRAQQGQGFGYLQYVIDTDSSLSAVLGISRDQFQIPNLIGEQPSLGLTVKGQTDYPSAWLHEDQREITDYGAISYLRSAGPLDFQISLFGRFSSLFYSPDLVGDLLYNGIAQTAYKRDLAAGTQAEGTYRVSADHTIRSGVIVEGDRGTSNTTSYVLPTDSAGNQTSDQPEAIPETGGKTAWTYSIYLQDEWKALPDLTVNLGGRFDVVDAYTHETQLSPRLNIVWQATPETTVHAGYARYLTPPPFELVGGETVSKFANTTAASSVTEDTAPRSERANYFDVGVSQKLFQSLTIGLDSYYKNSRDLLDEGQFGAPIILTPFNYAVGRQYGAELSATYQQGPLTAYTNLSGSVAEGKDIVSSQFNFSADDLAYIANHYIHLDHDQTVSISAGASYKLSGAVLSMDLLHGSGLRADGDHPNGSSLPDYTEINLGAARGFELPYAGTVKLRFDIINVFDEKYEIRDGTGIGVGAPQYGARRGFFMGVSRVF